MKFLLEFVACCTSCPSEAPQPLPQETKYLVLQTQVPRRRVPRKHWRVRGAGRHEWRPSLTSISEDVLSTAEKVNDVERPVRPRRWSLIKRKIASMSSRRDRSRSRSLDHDDFRSAPLSSIMPMLSPTPFMF